MQLFWIGREFEKFAHGLGAAGGGGGGGGGEGRGCIDHPKIYEAITCNNILFPHLEKLNVESNLPLLWFCIVTLSDWLKKTPANSPPIGSKTKTH